MPMKLFVYEHCPYCTKARMIFGLKNIHCDVDFLLNDDEKTPIDMIGKKMLPILQKQDGSFLPESLDIIAYVDALDDAPVLSNQPEHSVVTGWLEHIRLTSHRLCLPRCTQSSFPEFATDTAIQYYQHKKEKLIGISFAQAIAETPQHVQAMHAYLEELKPLLRGAEPIHGSWSLDDIHLFAILRMLTLVKSLQFPQVVEKYAHYVAEATKLPLYTQLAS